MSDIRFPKATREAAEHRHALAPQADDAFKAFSKAVFACGALDTRTKQLIAMAVAHAMPLVHRGTCEGRAPRGRQRRADHGSDAGAAGSSSRRRCC